MERNLGEQDFHNAIEELLERISKTLNKTSEKTLEKSKATYAAIENVVKCFPGTSNPLVNRQKALSETKKTKETTRKQIEKIEPTKNIFLNIFIETDNWS